MIQNKRIDAFNDTSIKVPFILPQITKDDLRAIKQAFDSPLLTDGPKLCEFENKFIKFTKSKFAIGVSNATSALQLSLKTLGIGEKDEVIIPDMTFVATGNVVLAVNATPVLADVDLDDMNISIESIKKNITSKTKAIIPVHFAGKACKIDKILKIGREYGLKIIEDCAHAIGTFYKGKHVGNYGDCGCFSFYPTKNFTTIEGGMIITNNKTIADYTRILRNHGISKTLKERFHRGKPWDYDVNEAGFNYRLDEIRASLGISQLKRVKKMNLLRRKAALYYDHHLKNIKGIITPSVTDDYSAHLYVIRIQDEYVQKRDQVFNKLLEKGIRTSVHYKPLHEFTVFRKKAKIYDKLDNSKQAYKEIISLPLYPKILRMEQDKVIEQLVVPRHKALIRERSGTIQL